MESVTVAWVHSLALVGLVFIGLMTALTQV